MENGTRKKKKIKNRKVRSMCPVCFQIQRKCSRLLRPSVEKKNLHYRSQSLFVTLFAWIIKYFIRRFDQIDRTKIIVPTIDRRWASNAPESPGKCREKDKFTRSCPKPVSRVGRWILKFTDRHGQWKLMGEMTTRKSDKPRTNTEPEKSHKRALRSRRRRDLVGFVFCQIVRC